SLGPLTQLLSPSVHPCRLSVCALRRAVEDALAPALAVRSVAVLPDEYSSARLVLASAIALVSDYVVEELEGTNLVKGGPWQPGPDNDGWHTRDTLRESPVAVGLGLIIV